MKQIAKKITEYVKKSKRAKLYGVFGLIYLIAVIFVMNDAWQEKAKVPVEHKKSNISKRSGG